MGVMDQLRHRLRVAKEHGFFIPSPFVPLDPPPKTSRKGRRKATPEERKERKRICSARIRKERNHELCYLREQNKLLDSALLAFVGRA